MKMLTEKSCHLNCFLFIKLTIRYIIQIQPEGI